jgi:AcrR family transcriptional regulator
MRETWADRTTLARCLDVTDHGAMASRKAPPSLEEAREAPVIDFVAVRRGEVPPDKPTSPVLTDDLAQTMEAPAAPRIQIMDAAEGLIAQHGLGGTSANAIADAATLGVDTLRAVFPDDTALLRALHERFCSQALRIVVEAAETAVFDRAAIDGCIDRTVRSLVDVVLGRVALVRAVLASGDPRMLEGERKWLGTVTSRVARAIDQVDGKPPIKDLAFALFVAVAVVHEVIVTSPHGSEAEVVVGNVLTLDKSAVHAHVAEAVRAFLARR